MAAAGEENASNLEKMNDDILRALECPACLNVMLSAIYVCMTGHSICESCWTALTNCPLCEKELASTRNYTLESIAEATCYPCENKEFGCSKIFNALYFDAHLKRCRYRKYKCKISPNSCAFEGRQDMLEEHIYQAHPLQVAQGPKNFFVWRSNVQSESATHLVVVQKDQLFYVFRFVKDNIMYWIAQYLGNCVEENVDFTFEVSLKRSTKKGKRIIVVNEYSLDNSVEDVEAFANTGYGVAIPMSVINSYKVQNVLRYQVVIRMRAEEGNNL